LDRELDGKLAGLSRCAAMCVKDAALLKMQDDPGLAETFTSSSDLICGTTVLIGHSKYARECTTQHSRPI